MNSLYRRLLQHSNTQHRLLSPLYHYSTKPKPIPKSQSSCAQSEPTSAGDWPRPSDIPFQAKVANSVQLIGYVHSPVHLLTAADGSSCSATVLTSASHSDSQSPDSLPLWVPVIFEGDLAHVAVSHLKENDCVYISGQLSPSLPHLNGSKVEASVQVVANDISFVEKDIQKNKSSNSFIQSIGETSNSSDSVSKQGNFIPDPWKDLLDNPKEWWDNRAAKQNGLVSKKYPDFKRKDGSSVLWLERPRKALLSKLTELEFDSFSPRAKEVKELKENGDSASDSWIDLVDNSKEWCDYRSSKLQGLVNSKYPDFKRKDGSSALWLDRAPRWVLAKLEGLEFHVQTQKSKAVKDNGDELWKDLVDNPDKWWDNRFNKIKERSPDFKHKETGEALWLSNSPSWVSLKLPPPKRMGNTIKT